jgi:site-specific recombinase XerD
MSNDLPSPLSAEASTKAEPPSTALAGPGAVVIRAPGGFAMALPAVIADAGEQAATTFEFFTARIPNAHTRQAYGRAVASFCEWCEAHRVTLRSLDAPTVAAYLGGLRNADGDGDGLSLASVKLTASGLRHWLDFLTERGVLPFNPSLSVRTERLVVTEGKTPVMEHEEARALFASLDAIAAAGCDLLALRDRAMFAVMLFGFVRLSAVCRMLVRDFEDESATAWLVLHEKGGKERRIPCHHQTREYLRAYIEAARFNRPPAGGEASQRRSPLFQSAPGRTGALSGKPIASGKVWEAVKRRCKAAGLPSSISNHSFRATGIALHQENGGRLEDAQALAGHADARTTRLYVRKERKVAQAEVERVQL